MRTVSRRDWRAGHEVCSAKECDLHPACSRGGQRIDGCRHYQSRDRVAGRVYRRATGEENGTPGRRLTESARGSVDALGQ